MQIIWNKNNDLKIISENNIILLNPKNVEKCNIVVDPSNVDSFNKMSSTFVITNYGEYEIKDDFIYKNFVIQKNKEKKKIYKLNIENITILDLDNINDDLLLEDNEESKGNIIEGNIDILLIPIGENFLSAKKAVEIKDNLSPKIVIPINYDPIKDDRNLKEFKAAFLNIEENDKFKINKKNLPSEEDNQILYLLTSN